MITAIFTVEYLVRLLVVPRPVTYARSFFGVIDLLALLPTYLSLFFIGAHSLIVIRALRLLRVFRILKLTRYAGEASELWLALRASRHKISAFILAMATVVVVVGALMYLIEGPQNEDFSSIPASMYFTVVTLTTLGFGDITPVTTTGRFLTAAVSLLGYGVLAVPTGIVSAEIASARAVNRARICPGCGHVGHDADARNCKLCGSVLGP
jgi:voltage-gated potassium channel